MRISRAVARCEHAVGRDRRMREADALRRPAALGMQERHRQPVGHHVEHGDPDVGALPGPAAADQGLQHAGMGSRAGRDVDDRNADPRRPLRPAGDRGEARFRLDQQIIGLAPRERPARRHSPRSSSRSARGCPRRRSRDVEAEPGERAGLEVLHEHIGARDQVREPRPVVGLGRSSTTDSLPRLSQTK